MSEAETEKERDRQRDTHTERERERQRHRQGEEVGSTWGARCGSGSQVSRIVPWAKGRRQTAAPARDPLYQFSTVFQKTKAEGLPNSF